MLRLKVGNSPLVPISRTFLCQCSCAGGGGGGAGVLPTHYWTKEHAVLERLTQGRSSAFPVSQKTYPICILTKQPKAKPHMPLCSQESGARLQNQKFRKNYINVTYWSLSSRAQVSLVCLKLMRHSPEKFLDTSMVVKMAPCRKHKCYFSILSRIGIKMNIAKDKVFKHSYTWIKY